MKFETGNHRFESRNWKLVGTAIRFRNFESRTSTFKFQTSYFKFLKGINPTIDLFLQQAEGRQEGQEI